MRTRKANEQHSAAVTSRRCIARTSRGPLWSLLFAFSSLLLGGGLPVWALAGTLNDIKFTSLPGGSVQVKLTLSEALSADPLNFTIDNPARIALDFPGTQLGLKNKTAKVGIGKVDTVTAVEAEGRTRVVVNLVQLVPYKIQTAGNTVTLTLDGIQSDITALKGATGASVPKAAAVSNKSPANMLTMPGHATGASVKGIDFRRGPRGEAQIMVNLSDPNIGINIDEQGGKLIVDFVDTTLPTELDRKLDVLDFATPAQEIDTTRHGNGTRMVVTPKGPYDHMAYQSDNIFTLELRPLSKTEQDELKKDKFGYTGERLSLNFQDIEVRAVLQLIADFNGFNLVASDTVTGRVTLRLKNVPWDQAMDLILKTKGLGMRKSGNVIMVAPQEEIASREKLELESQKQLQELSPLKTEFVHVNYAKAQALADLMKTKTNKLLTPRGNVSVDERTNTLLVQDTAEALGDLRRVVEALDIPVRQVLIESRIVVANDDFSKDIGVQFGYSQSNAGKTGFTSQIGGGIPGSITYPKTTAFAASGTQENYLVDLPVTNPAGAMNWAIGKIGSNLLQLQLSALQTEGRGEVIASPQVITANQKEALIETGTEIPYQEASSSGATSVSFKKAVLALKVTPHVTPDDRVIMDLKVNRDSVGTVFNGVPSIDTNEVDTQVLIDNGETVVLGGIYQSEHTVTKTLVPFFGELPYVGNLFKNNAIKATKKELLIFVTPKILKEAMSVSTR